MTASHRRDLLGDLDLLASRVRDLEGSRALTGVAWTPYTVAWQSSGTAPVLNNGTLTGYYAKTGRTVAARIMLNSGSGTVFGTGLLSWTLPFAAAVTGVPAAQFVHSGTMAVSTAGSGTFYTPNAIITQDAPTLVKGLVNGSGGFLSGTNPATFSGAGCQFQITITYESAS